MRKSMFRRFAVASLFVALFAFAVGACSSMEKPGMKDNGSTDKSMMQDNTMTKNSSM